MLIDHDQLEQIYYKYRHLIPSRLLHHPDYFQILSLLRRGQNDGELLQQVVAEKLRFILSEAITHVPFYRESIPLTAADIKRSENPAELLQFFPFLEKETIMNQQDRFLSDRYRNTRIHYKTSGGSSGQGIGVWRNKRLADIEKAFFHWELTRFGLSLERSLCVRIGAIARRKVEEHPIWRLGRQLMLSPYHVNERWRDEIVKHLNEYKPEYINAYPSSLYELAKLIEPGQLDFRVRAVLLNSEPALDYQLKKIFELFQVPILLNYGQTERTAIAFAEYRGQMSPYRLNPLYGYFENRCVEDQPEIVGTSLWNDVMPLIRYCTKDFGFIGKNGELEKIDGRAQEFLIDKSGNRIPGLSIVIDEPTWNFVKYYQIRQSQAGAITILLVPKEGQLSDEQISYVLEGQQKRWGGFFDISVREVDSIPLTKGAKRRLVVCDINSSSLTN